MTFDRLVSSQSKSNESLTDAFSYGGSSDSSEAMKKNIDLDVSVLSSPTLFEFVLIIASRILSSSSGFLPNIKYLKSVSPAECIFIKCSRFAYIACGGKLQTLESNVRWLLLPLKYATIKPWLFISFRKVPSSFF